MKVCNSTKRLFEKQSQESTVEKTVGSVSEYIKHVFNDISSSDNTLYFRGEKEKYPNIIPSAYRNQELVKNGTKKYYNELLSEIGYLDISDNASLFNVLAELQHYGASTRMVDISSNPLVALFFACQDGYNNNLKDGYVYRFQIEKNSEKYSNGHTAAIKMGLNFIDQEKINQFVYIMSYFHNNIGENSSQKDVLNNYITVEELIDELSRSFATNPSDTTRFGSEHFEKEHRAHSNVIFKLKDKILGQVVDSAGNPRTGKNSSDLENEIKDEIKNFLLGLAYDDTNFVKYRLGSEVKDSFSVEKHQEYLIDIISKFLNEFFELLNQVSKTKERLQFPNLIYKDITSCQFVKAFKTQQRIINQSGLFILAPFFDCREKDLSTIQKQVSDVIKSHMGTTGTSVCYQIPGAKKKDILQELSVLGIHAGFIYPDIENKSKAILNKYMS